MRDEGAQNDVNKRSSHQPTARAEQEEVRAHVCVYVRMCTGNNIGKNFTAELV